MLDIKLNVEEEDTGTTERITEAEQRKKDSEFEPSWEEVWDTGFTRPTGTVKVGIFQMKNSGPDEERLLKVKRAIEEGTLGSGVCNLSQFTKSHALRMYQQLMEVEREDIIAKMIEEKPDNYHTILTEDQLERVVELLAEEDIVAIDTETTGLTWEDVTVGMSITMPIADIHVYIPYGHEDKEGNLLEEQLERAFVHTTLKEPLEREGFKIIYFNAGFDYAMLSKDGIDTRDNVYFDPMVAMHVLNENEPRYNLKGILTKYGQYFGFGGEHLGFDELFSNDPIDFIRADLEIASIYGCKDSHITYELYKWQKAQFERLPELGELYFNIEQPIHKVSIEMERNGFLMDEEFAEEYGKELSARIQELEEIMYNNWGDINTNSPLQLKEKLFKELGYEDISGKGSTNASVLKQLAKKHVDVNALVEYRDLNKLYTTYIKSLPKMVQRDVPEYGVKGDGRLHGRFNQSGTKTGRFSSNSPNLQNLPSEARPLIIAPEGKYIIGVDYSRLMHVWL